MRRILAAFLSAGLLFTMFPGAAMGEALPEATFAACAAADAVLLGAVCVGVGLMTGADAMRVYSTLDERYNISAYQQAYTQYAGELMDAVSEALQSPAA